MNERNGIAVTETGNDRIQIFSSDGTYLRSFSRNGDKQGEFNFPTGVAFDNNGHIVVVDGNSHRVNGDCEQERKYGKAVVPRGRKTTKKSENAKF